MANFKQNFWIDTERKTLVKGFNTTSTVANPKFIQGDTVELNVILLKPTGQNGQPYSVVPITDQTLKVGLGLVDTAPTSGIFTLTFDGDTTTALNFDDDATTVQTALNAIASITTAGGVTVTGDAPGPLTIKFNSTGAQNYITATTTDIIPTSYLANIRKQTGDGSTKEIQVLKIRQSLVALQTSFTTISAPQITITEQIAGGAGVNEFQTFEIDQECEGGSFSVTFGGETAIVTYQSSAVDFQANLEALSSIGAGNIAVEKVSDILYNIYFTGTLGGANQALMTADATGLKGFSGFTGTLSLGSYSVDEFLNGSDSKSCVLEVELNQTGNKSTVLKIGATIENDGIDDAQSSPPQTGINWEALIDEKADKVNVLELDNTTLFTPSADYHPATKKYIDDINTSIQSSLSTISSDLDTAETNIANLQSKQTFTGVWEYDSSTTNADPGAGKIRFDNTTLSSITKAYIDIYEQTDYMAGVIYLLQPGDALYIRRKNDGSNGALFRVISRTNSTGYYTLDLTLISTLGSLPTTGSGLSISFILGSRGFPAMQSSGETTGRALTTTDLRKEIKQSSSASSNQTWTIAGSVIPIGSFITLVNDSAYLMTIDGSGGSTINNKTFFHLFQGESITLGYGNGTNITIISSKIRSKSIFLNDAKSYNVSAGDSSTDNIHTRVLNSRYGELLLATLASNAFTPIKGEYKVRVKIPAYKVGNTFPYLLNITSSTIVRVGQSSKSGSGDTTQIMISIDDVITANGTDQYGLRHWCELAATDGLGVPHNKTGYSNFYAQVELELIR